MKKFSTMLLCTVQCLMMRGITELQDLLSDADMDYEAAEKYMISLT